MKIAVDNMYQYNNKIESYGTSFLVRRRLTIVLTKLNKECILSLDTNTKNYYNFLSTKITEVWLFLKYTIC